MELYICDMMIDYRCLYEIGSKEISKKLKIKICEPKTSKSITKTYLYKFDPLEPHFYIVKLGFTGVYIIFLISAQKIDCGYSLEPPRRGGSNEYPQYMF